MADVRLVLGFCAVGLVMGASMLHGCGSSTDGSQLPSGAGGNSSGTATNSGGQGGGIFTSNNGGSGGGESCAQQSSQATLQSRPVDIIVVIDNSGSMTAEIQEVEYQINANFAAILDNANPPIDYRVIMLSDYGASTNNDICVAAPLGGTPDADMDGHCDTIPSTPANTTKFFHHSRSISSHNAWCRLLQDYDLADEYNLQPNGYKDALRDDSFKFIAVITDDNVSCSFNGHSYSDGNNPATLTHELFDADLQALSPLHFGADPMNRNYSFWSIIALAPHNPTAAKPYGDPHPPDATVAPVITSECSPSSVNPGTGYQALSILTGGYRYPTCGLDYTDIFSLMAQGVIAGAKVACEFDVPPDPPNQKLDLSTVQVQYSSMGQPVATFDQVPTAADCTPTSFYIDMNKIILCPDACNTVQSDPDAEINILYGCEIGID